MMDSRSASFTGMAVNACPAPDGLLSSKAENRRYFPATHYRFIKVVTPLFTSKLVTPLKIWLTI